jgi:hypothetical protein
MFCPSCGTESIGLNYCNRCGANLSGTLAAPVVEFAPISVTKPILIIGVVILLITLGGFGGIVSGTIEMVRNGAGGVSPALPIFGFPSILTIDILLIRQLSKLISAALSRDRIQAPRSLPQAQHDPRFAPATTARFEPAPSVTENTTRFFDPYRAPAEIERTPADKFKV